MLNGTWRFGFVRNGVSADVVGAVAKATAGGAVPEPLPVPLHRNVSVPSAHEQHGTAFYLTRVRVSVGRGALLQFGACAFSCSVYVDGARLLHRHAFGGYTPFDVCVISTDLG